MIHIGDVYHGIKDLTDPEEIKAFIKELRYDPEIDWDYQQECFDANLNKGETQNV